MRRGSRRPRPSDTVAFPATPMLDMAFQLLAFFVLTFHTPTRASRLELRVPPNPAPAPAAPALDAKAENVASDELLLSAKSDEHGRLRALSLGADSLKGEHELKQKLDFLRAKTPGGTIRIAFAADERLMYEHAARLVGICARVGAVSVRLIDAPPANEAGE